MKKTLLAIALASSLTSFGAVAADKAPEPSYTLAGNFSLVSDYRFRGVTQTQEGPAVQGGLDLTLKNGGYVGTWTSNVKQWANPGGQQEIDFYGGYRTEIKGFGLDIGGIQYWYPRNTASVTNNTFEYYVAMSYGPISYKVSKANGNWFGIEANGAVYQELNLSHSISEKISVGFHIGSQTISEAGGTAGKNYGFTDYKISGAYDLGDGYSIGLAASRVSFKVTADGDSSTGWYYFDGKKLGGSAVVASITKTF